MARMLLIGLFGALGAMSRASVSAWLNPTTSAAIPMGTLAVNALGSFALGFFAGLTATSSRIPEVWRAPLTMGFLGSFTTFSTFSVETVRLAEAGAWSLFSLNLVLQLGIGLVAAAAGLALGRMAGGG